MIAPAFSALAPAGIQSQRIATLFSSFLGIAAVVFVLVIGAFVAALVTRRPAADVPKAELPKPEEGRRRRNVTIAVVLTTFVLFVMLYLSVSTTRALASLGTKDAVTIDVVGHKWWWELRYPGSVAGLQFTTAYEMHVPVGRPVEVRLQSVDVIHSFWVPSLHGKRDVIPGKPSTLVFQADEPGRYEGQCAEYCGTQHANMRFIVVAESQADFDAWLRHSLEPAHAPANDEERHGLEVFEKSRCIMCHSIGGTTAFATVGPNLTHLASRTELAMGTLPNTRGHLAGWIVDPQSSKPGTTMPGTPLPPEDLNALLTYLGSLK
ncbi:MAG: coxB [Labilithrix sp.]|nr:coxB [Labilithrix sp.]